MLAERKTRVKWSLNPRGNLWSQDSNKFGQRMLEKMGWKTGSGLGVNEQGITEPLKVAYKSNKTCIGFKENGEEWIKQQAKFQDFLAELNNSHSNDTSLDDNEKGKESLEKKSQQSRARVHYKKFTQGKDLSNRSTKELACILGVMKTEEEPVSEYKNSGNNFNEIATIGGNVNDHFSENKNKHKFNIEEQTIKKYKSHSDNDDDDCSTECFADNDKIKSSKTCTELSVEINESFDDEGTPNKKKKKKHCLEMSVDESLDIQSKYLNSNRLQKSKSVSVDDAETTESENGEFKTSDVNNWNSKFNKKAHISREKVILNSVGNEDGTNILKKQNKTSEKNEEIDVSSLVKNKVTSNSTLTKGKKRKCFETEGNDEQNGEILQILENKMDMNNDTPCNRKKRKSKSNKEATGEETVEVLKKKQKSETNDDIDIAEVVVKKMDINKKTLKEKKEQKSKANEMMNHDIENEDNTVLKKKRNRDFELMNEVINNDNIELFQNDINTNGTSIVRKEKNKKSESNEEVMDHDIVEIIENELDTSQTNILKKQKKKTEVVQKEASDEIVKIIGNETEIDSRNFLKKKMRMKSNVTEDIGLPNNETLKVRKNKKNSESNEEIMEDNNDIVEITENKLDDISKKKRKKKTDVIQQMVNDETVEICENKTDTDNKNISKKKMRQKVKVNEDVPHVETLEVREKKMESKSNEDMDDDIVEITENKLDTSNTNILKKITKEKNEVENDEIVKVTKNKTKTDSKNILKQKTRLKAKVSDVMSDDEIVGVCENKGKAESNGEIMNYNNYIMETTESKFDTSNTNILKERKKRKEVITEAENNEIIEIIENETETKSKNISRKQTKVKANVNEDVPNNEAREKKRKRNSNVEFMDDDIVEITENKLDTSNTNILKKRRKKSEVIQEAASDEVLEIIGNGLVTDNNKIIKKKMQVIENVANDEILGVKKKQRKSKSNGEIMDDIVEVTENKLDTSNTNILKKRKKKSEVIEEAACDEVVEIIENGLEIDNNKISKKKMQDVANDEIMDDDIVGVTEYKLDTSNILNRRRKKSEIIQEAASGDVEITENGLEIDNNKISKKKMQVSEDVANDEILEVRKKQRKSKSNDEIMDDDIVEVTQYKLDTRNTSVLKKKRKKKSEICQEMSDGEIVEIIENGTEKHNKILNKKRKIKNKVNEDVTNDEILEVSKNKIDSTTNILKAKQKNEVIQEMTIESGNKQILKKKRKLKSKGNEDKTNDDILGISDNEMITSNTNTLKNKMSEIDELEGSEKLIPETSGYSDIILKNQKNKHKTTNVLLHEHAETLNGEKNDEMGLQNQTTKNKKKNINTQSEDLNMSNRSEMSTDSEDETVLKEDEDIVCDQFSNEYIVKTMKTSEFRKLLNPSLIHFNGSNLNTIKGYGCI